MNLEKQKTVAIDVVKRFIKGENWEKFKKLYELHSYNTNRRGKLKWNPSEKDWELYLREPAPTVKEFQTHWADVTYCSVMRRIGAMRLLEADKKDKKGFFSFLSE